MELISYSRQFASLFHQMHTRIHRIQFAWLNRTCLLSMRSDQSQWYCHMVHIEHNLRNYDWLKVSHLITRADEIWFDGRRCSHHIRVFYICGKSKHKININSFSVWEHLLNDCHKLFVWRCFSRELFYDIDYFYGKLPILDWYIVLIQIRRYIQKNPSFSNH